MKAADGRPLEFDVVSIRLNKSGAESMNIVSPPHSDGLTITNMPLASIVGWAYGISIRNQIAGMPDWALKDRYDIQAKVSDADVDAFRKVVDPIERISMLQKILEDHFKMKSHYETREVPAYALVVAKGGSKMTEIQPAIGPNGMKTGGSREVRPGEIRSMGMPMLPLVRQLSIELGRVVVDETGLKGYYNFTLKWTPDQGAASSAVAGEAPIDSSAPSIFTAIQEQLGLKLEAKREPMSTLVVDHLEQASEN